MPNHLDLPPELNSLIEKREQDDRRQQTPAKEAKAADEAAEANAPDVERRSGKDRRANDS